MEAGVSYVQDGKVPDRRFGLEQEFFLVDEAGVLRGEADRFLLRCREAAGATGLDPGCFKAECATSMVEITTPPSFAFADLAGEYLSNLRLALRVGSELGLRLYPLATYPLPISPVIRADLRYRLKAHTIGYGRFLHAGRCAGAHLHLELPPGTVWPGVKAARKASSAAREELLDLYNLATALDPALIALTRSGPFYEGQTCGLAARTVRYRGALGMDGVYAEVQEVGALQPYAGSVEDLVERERRRYRAWFRAMDLAGVERRLFARAGGNLHRASWNPVRLNPLGTVEIRSMDGNYPEIVLATVALVRGAADRVRHGGLRVLPTGATRTLELREGALLVPDFAYLSGQLFEAAATAGVENPGVVAYLDSLVEFAAAQGEKPVHLQRLKPPGGGFRTTESEILQTFPLSRASITEEQGLRLVRESCRRLEKEVPFLFRRYQEAARHKGPGEIDAARGEVPPIPV